MKTPPYNIKSAHAWRKRKMQDGWKYFSILAPPEVIERLRQLYKELTSQ